MPMECEVVTGAGVLHSLWGTLVADALIYANIVGAASFPCILPPSKCALQTLECSLTLVFTLLILTSHLCSNFLSCKGKL